MKKPLSLAFGLLLAWTRPAAAQNPPGFKELKIGDPAPDFKLIGIYTEASMEPLIKALDPESTGPQPHTVFIKPGGEIAFRHTGMIAEAELLEKVLEVMTPYYQP